MESRFEVMRAMMSPRRALRMDADGCDRLSFLSAVAWWWWKKKKREEMKFDFFSPLSPLTHLALPLIF
jgi:hypothetical protein